MSHTFHVDQSPSQLKLLPSTLLNLQNPRTDVSNATVPEVEDLGPRSSVFVGIAHPYRQEVELVGVS